MKASAVKVISAALGLPCWQVRWDSQVGLDMNFGPPSMKVREPRTISGGSRRVRAGFARRGIYLHGTHWLVAYPGTWRLELADGLIVRDSSASKWLDIAVARLKGEILDGMRIDAHSGDTTFYFDLGGRVVVRGGVGLAPDDELWSMHDRTRFVSVHGGGAYSSGSVKQSEAARIPIAADDTRTFVLARNRRLRRQIAGIDL